MKRILAIVLSVIMATCAVYAGDPNTTISDGSWHDTATWSAGVIPVDGHTVTVTHNLTLTNLTAVLDSFTMSTGTLTFANDDTRLRATNVTISGGTVTHMSCGTNSATSNRVYIICSNLTLSAGARIDTDGMGYEGGGDSQDGFGPGGGFYSGGGAGYGGRGGDSLVSDRGATYGSADAPLQAGSGGAAYRSVAIGGHGGGAIHIEAIGRVVVNGTISGNGTKGGPAWGGVSGGGGSGGSVYITCNSIAGTGTISADAGDSGVTTLSIYDGSGGGGGGRVAIGYSPAVQSNETATLTISAAEGVGGLFYAKRSEPSYGVPGTIHMTSTQLMHENLGGGQYIVPGITSWSVGNLSLTNGTVVFPTNIMVNVQTNFVTRGNGALQVSDVDLRVGGNVLIAANAQVRTTFTGGPNAKTVLGGDLIVSNAHFLVQGVSSNETSLHVGGDLLLTDSGAMYVQAGITNDATPDYGALVSVTGALTVAPSAVLYPYSDGTNGGSVLFRATTVHVGTNAMIDADLIGFIGGPSYSDGRGPGRSLNGYAAGGAGYGGVGGDGTSTAGGITYGDTNAPIHPGSSAGCYGGSIGGDGGGLVRMEATGEIQIDGTITVDGEDGPGSWGGGYGGAGAGGGISLRCTAFTGIGRLRADGGDANSGGSAGGGGGGRITVWLTGHSWDGSPIPSHPTCSVTNGLAYNSGAPGETGTVTIAVDPWSPRIDNLAAPNVSGTTADAVGDLITIGNAPVTVSVYWGRTNGFDEKSDWATHDLIGPAGLGEITNALSSLSAGTRYYYRFYATNAYGHDWGYPSASFSTEGGIEVDNDGGATDITLTSARLRGEVLVGNPDPTATLYWGTSNGYENPAAWSNPIDAGLVTNWTFSGLATGLVANQTYFYNSYITNSAGEDWAPVATNFTTGMPEISINDPEIIEGPSGNTTNVSFTVSLSGVSAIDVSVAFQTSNGTAQAGSDYQSTNGTLVIPAGASTGIVIVPVDGDNVDEFPSESFFIYLDSPTEATTSDGTGRCTIIDDDDAWQLKTWSGQGNWNSVTNWSPTGFPGPADTAVIPVGQSCTLTGSTFFASLTNSGTLTFSGTNGLLSGTDITIDGTVTHLPQSATTTNTLGEWIMDHSLHIRCTNLTILTTGRIDVCGMGYAGGATGSNDGYGPGAGLSISGGAGHGGIGGSESGGGTYGSSSVPCEPGSGGGSYASGAIGGDGGGVIRVEVSARIRVDGTITAEGGAGGPNYGGVGGGGGSGGSVWMTCRSISGSGHVSANGGDGGYLEGRQGSGGGGRVAIEYDETAQTAESQTPIISAAGGHSGGAYVTYSGSSLGKPGTVSMPDDQLLGSTLDGGVFEIPGFTAWTVDSLLLTNGTVIFPDSFHLTVTGDITARTWGALELTNTVLNVGGSVTLSSVPKVGTRITSGPNHASTIAGNFTLDGSALRLVGVSSNETHLTIKGNCLLTNGATFSIYSGITNAGTANDGAWVEVQGHMTLAPASWVYPHSDITNGGSPMFQLGSLTVEATAGFNANTIGYTGRHYDENGYGPGGGGGGMDAGGGGYGGVGGNGDAAAGGGTYGDADEPLDPGSGGGSYRSSYGGDGGGLVRIDAPAGTVRVDGVLTANGGNGGGSYGGGYGGAGSGGGIHIICKSIDGSGDISANGGNADASGNGGGGGGGRIAVWSQYYRYTGVTTVTAGTGYAPSGGGTIVWGKIPFRGMLLILR